MDMPRKIAKKRVVVLGASGYTGAELIRLLLLHPYVDIVALTADSQAGKAVHDVYPHLRDCGLPDLVKPDAVKWDGIDAAFCCLPHGASQSIIPDIPESVVVIDLSADYRLKDEAVYAKWYGAKHHTPEKLSDAVYGLSEINASAIKKAQLIACPGCYPTAAQLPIVPLLQAGIIAPDGIVIDAKSGVTGAGRSVKQGNLYCEVNEGMSAYGVGQHRHLPEIEQGFSDAVGEPVQVSFTPHLVPMSRGILSTAYATLRAGKTAVTAQKKLADFYADMPFVTVLDSKSSPPSTHAVRGSNRCMVGVYADRVKGRIVLVSAIDNLIKGASGQAVQNFNLRFKFYEMTALEGVALFP